MICYHYDHMKSRPRRLWMILSWIILLHSVRIIAFAQIWSWVSPAPTGDIVRSVCFLDSLKGWLIAGSSGVLLHTSDGGSTWDYEFAGRRVPLVACAFADSNHGWLTGGEAIFRTSNGGKSWTQLNTPPEQPFISVQCFGNDTVFATTQSNMIVRSVDGGDSWSEFRINYSNITASYFLNSKTGYVVGDKLYKTRRG